MGAKSLLLVLAAAILAAGCTDANPFLDLDPRAGIMRMGIEAEVCSPDSIVDQVPYKILFVIDTSLSNRWNDADEHRVDAFVQAVETHVSKDSVYFGIVTFNDYAHRPTLVFTDNKNILLTAAATLTGEFAGGGTNYEDAVHEMYQFIVDDLNAMTNPMEALRTHYLVYWLSDGMPTFGTTDRPTLVANIEAVMEYLKPKVGEFKLNTLYLESSGEWETEEEIAGARMLLAEMAEAGEGTFTNISNGESFEFDIDPTPQVRSFRLVKAVASNANAHFGSRHPLPDSDGDGLRDEVEIGLGLDPTLADTDGDFYRDAVEFKSGWLSPHRPDPGCFTDDRDSDGDGLWDCEEQVIGTDPYKPDTDGDYLLDSIEFLLDGSPLSDEPTTDSDLDGLPDSAEVIAHLEPHGNTTGPDQELWAYRYELAKEWVEPDTDQRCYSLQVDNVSVYQTLQTPMHPEGWQTIEFVVVFETDDGLGLVHYARAKGRVGFLFPGEIHPPSAVVVFEPGDFVPLSATCVSGGPGCHLPPQENCGDGLLSPGEECDEADLNEETCESLGYFGGSLACDQTCRLDVSGCEGQPLDICGNGIRENDEECDGEDLGGVDCEELGYAGDGLACGPDCLYDTGDCEPARDCSSGALDAGECALAGGPGLRGGFACQTGEGPAGDGAPVWLVLILMLFARRRVA
jgi:MYXO-CTERM domain-containing protein